MKQVMFADVKVHAGKVFRVFRLVNFRLTEGEYEEIADETLESLAERFDALPDEGFLSSDYDVQLAVCTSASFRCPVVSSSLPKNQSCELLSDSLIRG